MTTLYNSHQQLRQHQITLIDQLYLRGTQIEKLQHPLDHLSGVLCNHPLVDSAVEVGRNLVMVGCYNLWLI